MKEQILAWCISVVLSNMWSSVYHMGAPVVAGIWEYRKRDFILYFLFIFQAKEVAEQMLMSVFDTLHLTQLKTALRYVIIKYLLMYCVDVLASWRGKHVSNIKFKMNLPACQIPRVCFQTFKTIIIIPFIFFSLF